jgi:hypothetical protein
MKCYELGLYEPNSCQWHGPPKAESIQKNKTMVFIPYSTTEDFSQFVFVLCSSLTAKWEKGKG